MTSIVIGGLGKAITTGIIKVGTEITPGIIGQGKNFIGHHQVILVMEDRMVNQVDQGMEELRVSPVEADHMVNQVDQGMADLRVSQAGQGLVVHRANQAEEQAEVDPTAKCMDHRAKLVDLDLSQKWLEGPAEADLRVK
jgi:hypothetical protein